MFTWYLTTSYSTAYTRAVSSVIGAVSDREERQRMGVEQPDENIRIKHRNV